jgi:hypothetical protein
MRQGLLYPTNNLPKFISKSGNKILNTNKSSVHRHVAKHPVRRRWLSRLSFRLWLPLTRQLLRLGDLRWGHDLLDSI